MFSILFIVLAVSLLLWIFLSWLFAPVLWGGWRTCIVIVFFLFAPIIPWICNFLGYFQATAFIKIWFYRPFLYALLFAPFLSFAALTGILFGLLNKRFKHNGRIAVYCMATILLFFSINGYLDSQRLTVKHLNLYFLQLPIEFEGLRIVQLSDLHIGIQTSEQFLAQIYTEVQQAQPDIIIITGDHVDHYPDGLQLLENSLGKLHAPLGIIAVVGNHDIYAGWADVRKNLEKMGWIVLLNKAIQKQKKNAVFWIAGIGDPAALRHTNSQKDNSQFAPDVDKTLSSIPETDFCLGLVHNPVLWPQLAKYGVDLTLSGHTHYGQFAIPQLNWCLASLFLEYSMGSYVHEGAMLYINPGTNYWGIPFRFGTPPEISVITLHK